MIKTPCAGLFVVLLELVAACNAAEYTLGKEDAVVEFDLPKGTTVSYQGRNVYPKADGDAPVWIIKGISRRTAYAINLQFSDGSIRQRVLLLHPAARVRLAVATPQASAQEMVLQIGHSGAVAGLAVSPDGTRMITASVDESAVLWDIERDRQMLSLKGHTAAVTAVTFAPKSQMAATAGSDGKVFIWDLLTAAPKSGVKPMVHASPVHSVQFSADGSKVLTATGGDPHRSGEGAAVLWNVATAERIRQFHDGSYGIFCAALSPDGSKIAGASYQRTIVWEANSSKELFELPLCRNVEFSSDGKLVLTDGIVWDATSGARVAECSFAGKPTTACFAHDGKRAVIGTDKGIAIVWNVKNGSQVARLSHTEPVYAAAFSPDDSVIYTSSGGDSSHMGAIRRWQWNQPTPMSTRLFDVAKNHEAPDFIQSAWFNELGFELIAGLDGPLSHWSHQAFSIKSKIENLPGRATSVTRSRSGRSLVASVQYKRASGSVYRWSPQSHDPAVLMHDLAGDILDFAVSPDKTKIASIAPDSAVLSDFKTGERLHRLSIDHAKYVSVVYPPSGPLALSLADDGQIRVWNLSSGILHVSLVEAKGEPGSAALSPDGKYVAALFHTLAADEKEVTTRVVVWEIATGNLLWRGAGRTVLGTFVGFSSKGSEVLAGYADGKLTVSDVATGAIRTSVTCPGVVQQVGNLPNLDKQAEEVLGAEFSSDDQTLVICRRDLGIPQKTRIETWNVTARNRTHATDCELDASAFSLKGDARSVILSVKPPSIVDPSVDAAARDLPFACLVDPSTGKILRKFESRELSFANPTVRIASDGAMAAVIERGSPEFSLLTLKSGHLSKHSSRVQSERDVRRGYTAAEFSPSGQLLLTSLYEDVELWELKAAPKRRATLPHQYSGWPTSMAFRHDEAQTLTANASAAYLWDTSQGKLLKKWTAQTGAIVAVGFQADRALVITCESDIGILRIWSVGDGRRLCDLQRSRGEVRFVRLSHDGKLVFAAMASGAEVIWDTSTGAVAKVIKSGNEKSETEVRPSFANAVADARLSEDGKRLVTLHGGATWVEQLGRYRDVWTEERGGLVLAWEFGKSEPMFSISALSRDHVAKSVALTSDARMVVTAGTGKNAIVCWDLETYRRMEVFRLPNDAEDCLKVKTMPDGTLLTSGGGAGNAGSAVLIDASTGLVQHVFEDIATVTSAAASPDDTLVAAGDTQGFIQVWEAKAPFRRLLTIAGRHRPAQSIEISPDNRHLLTSDGRQSQLWEKTTGDSRAEIGYAFDAARGAVSTFSPDGKQVLVGGGGQVLRGPEAGKFYTELSLWDVETGKLLHPFEGPAVEGSQSKGEHQLWLTAIAFSPDATVIASGSQDGEIILRDAKDGSILRRFSGHDGPIKHLAISQDNRQVLSISANSICHCWDIGTNDELLRLVSFRDGSDWAAVSPEGLFDGSYHGRTSVYYRRIIGDEIDVRPMDNYFQLLYRGGLTYFQRRGDRAIPREGIGEGRPPSLRVIRHALLAGDAQHRVKLEVDVQNHGGGAQIPRLYRGDSKGFLKALGTSKQLSPEITRWTYLLPPVGGIDRVEVRCGREDGLWESEPVTTELGDGGAEAQKPALFVLSIGALRPGDTLTLPARNARTIYDLFHDNSLKTFRSRDLKLINGEENHPATRANVLNSIDALTTRVAPADVLVVFLSGHGTMKGQRYFFITVPDSENRSDEASIAVDELADRISQVPCEKRILLVDSCFAGGATSMNDLFAYRGDIARSGRRSNIFTLAAASQNEIAWENPKLQASNLTFALKASVTGSNNLSVALPPLVSAGKDESIGVTTWFDLAKENISRLHRFFDEDAPETLEVGGQGASFELFSRP